MMCTTYPHVQISQTHWVLSFFSGDAILDLDLVGLDPAEVVGESFFPFAFSLFGFALLSLRLVDVEDVVVEVVVSLMPIFVR